MHATNKKSSKNTRSPLPDIIYIYKKYNKNEGYEAVEEAKRCQ
jgi:hypothetical protein